jgi:hypothetical protein
MKILKALAEDEGTLLFLFDTSSHKVFRENHPFRRNAWTFMKFIPGLHTTWHICVFHDQYTLTNDVLHIMLCVDIISFLLEFSFEFIWIFQNINNKRFPYATLGWISWKSMHFSWKDDSLWILCVSWCQIERAACLRLRLGNLTSKCYPRFKNMKWFWQDKHNSKEL